MGRVHRTLVILGLTASVLSLVGCKGDGSNGSSDGDLPLCSQVWVKGETLPTDYHGCKDGRRFTSGLIIDCVGDNRFTTYRRLHAFLGGAIVGGGRHSQEYLGALSACTRGG